MHNLTCEILLKQFDSVLTDVLAVQSQRLVEVGVKTISAEQTRTLSTKLKPRLKPKDVRNGSAQSNNNAGTTRSLQTGSTLMLSRSLKEHCAMR
jgi:hypothetical protein